MEEIPELILLLLALCCCCCCCSLLVISFRRRKRHVHSEVLVRLGPKGEWVDRKYHPRGFLRWGFPARMAGQDPDDPKGNHKGNEQRALMAEASESLAAARGIMMANREGTGGEGTEVRSAEQIAAARRQFSGERVRRGEALAAAKVRLEAATAQLAAAEANATAAAEVGIP